MIYLFALLGGLFLALSIFGGLLFVTAAFTHYWPVVVTMLLVMIYTSHRKRKTQ